MDIPALSTAMSQSQLQNAVGVSVTKMSLNTAQQESDGVIQMMQNSSASAPHPNLGANLDIRL